MKPEIKALCFTVPQEDIYYISWIIDAAEGLGFMQTDDAKAGRVTIFTPSGNVSDILALMDSLRGEGIKIEHSDEISDVKREKI